MNLLDGNEDPVGRRVDPVGRRVMDLLSHYEDVVQIPPMNTQYISKHPFPPTARLNRGNRPEKVIDLSSSNTGMLTNKPDAEVKKALLAELSRGKNFVIGSPEWLQAIMTRNTQARPDSLVEQARGCFVDPYHIPAAQDNDDIAIYPNSSILLFHEVIRSMFHLYPNKTTVLFPEMHFDQHLLIPSLCRGKNEIIPTDPEVRSNSSKLTAAALDKALTVSGGKSRTDVSCVVIANPSVPSGESYTEDELRKIAKVCIKHGVMVVSDEIYAGTEIQSKHISIGALTVEHGGVMHKMHNHVLTLSGASKVFLQYSPRFSMATTGNKDLIRNLRERIENNQDNLYTAKYMLAVAPSIHANNQKVFLQGTVDRLSVAHEGINMAVKQIRGLECEVKANATPFSIIDFTDQNLFRAYGIDDNMKLWQYIYFTTGVHAGPLTPNCADRFSIRINGSINPLNPAEDQEMAKIAVDTAIKRIDALLKDMRAGKAPNFNDVYRHFMDEMFKPASARGYQR